MSPGLAPVPRIALTNAVQKTLDRTCVQPYAAAPVSGPRGNPDSSTDRACKALGGRTRPIGSHLKTQSTQSAGASVLSLYQAVGEQLVTLGADVILVSLPTSLGGMHAKPALQIRNHGTIRPGICVSEGISQSGEAAARNAFRKHQGQQQQ